MKILIIVGTRPEAIKFAPLIKKLKSDSYFDIKVCLTGQHKEMLQQVMDFFEIEADFDMKLMKKNQTLHDLSARALTELNPIVAQFRPEVVFVQGDTTTAFIGGLAAFYAKVKVAHLEAGLRSGDKYSPFPEEVNRKLLSVITDFHFAPTAKAKDFLHQENYTENVWVVGNTVIDALLLGVEILKTKKINFLKEFDFISSDKKIILVTAHRRESFGEPLENICSAIVDVAEHNDSVHFVYPVHYNPNVREVVFSRLQHHDQVSLIDPVEYSKLIWLMQHAHIILTDSGGIQEEAPTLGKPVLVLRDVTERMEGVEAGTAKLVGTDRRHIKDALQDLLENKDGRYDAMSKAVNPYGDGTTSDQIIEVLKKVTL